jgi:heterotetrameric sarcosine oxidase gamma subunit
VADLSWNETTPLSRIYEAKRHGAADGTAGLGMAEQTGFELVQVMARRGQWDATAQACLNAYGKTPPTTPQAVAADGAVLIWSGPDQFLILSARGTAFEKAGTAFAGVASLSEQSDARSLLRISGLRARDMLAKVCSLDLHPQAFPAGAAATSFIDHTAVNLWRAADADGEAVFHLLIFGTFAESLWHMLLDSGAEYGIAIDAASPWQG